VHRRPVGRAVVRAAQDPPAETDGFVRAGEQRGQQDVPWQPLRAQDPTEAAEQQLAHARLKRHTRLNGRGIH
ncbi:hypothetical protein X777_07502, partial [Ooceraea biroi]